MGSSLKGQIKKEASIIWYTESPGDSIILVEKYWKYKRDISQYIGIKHAFVVTTTQSGTRLKWDAVYGKNSRWSQFPKADEGDFYVYDRKFVEPEMTEADLMKIIHEDEKEYDVVYYNCWIHSNRIFDVFSLVNQPGKHE